MIYCGLDLGKRNDYAALVCARRRKITTDKGELVTPPASPLVVKDKIATVDIAHGKSPGAKISNPRTRNQYMATHVQRFDIGTPYTELVSRVSGLFTRPDYAGQTLVIDQTGVGQAVVDMFRQAQREPVTCPKCKGELDACLMCVGSGRILLNAVIVAVDISGQLGAGGGATWVYDEDANTWRVHKRELISVLLVLMESVPSRFLIDPRLPHAKLLIGELDAFRAKRKPGSKNESLEAWREKDHDDLVLAACIMLWYAEAVGGGRPWARL